MNCPQCGSSGYEDRSECKSCGFNSAFEDDALPVRSPISDPKRDVMNGVGLGCTVMCCLWFLIWTGVAVVATHIHRFAPYGPGVSATVPLAAVAALYLIVRRKPSGFAKGLGISLLITLAIALAFGYIGTRYHDNKPPANGTGNGFE